MMRDVGKVEMKGKMSKRENEKDNWRGGKARKGRKSKGKSIKAIQGYEKSGK